MNSKYKEQAENLAKAIDIASDIIRHNIPKDWTHELVNFYIETNNDLKKRVLNPEPQYTNLKSLQYAIEEVFTNFQEGHGPEIDIFWEKIKEVGLPYKRENKMEKILKCGKIRNHIEYEYIIDTIVPLQQDGFLTDNDIKRLNQMLKIYEE